MKKNSTIKILLFLQIAICLFSFSGVFQKLSSRFEFLSLGFFLMYGISVLILLGFAFVWQMFLKRLPLTVAYSNRAVALIWSVVWGVLFFKETIEWNTIVGAFIIIFGIYQVMKDND